jgi:hypothetical protein
MSQRNQPVETVLRPGCIHVEAHDRNFIVISIAHSAYHS